MIVLIKNKLGVFLKPIIKLFFFSSIFFLSFQVKAFSGNLLPEYLVKRSPKADSIIKNMTIDQKIGQLFMIAVNTSTYSKEKAQAIKNLIVEYHIGGVIFMKGNYLNQISYTNYFQTELSIPLFIGMDAEWGLAMRLKNTPKYPWQMTLGAVSDDKLIYQMGFNMAKQFKAMGVNISFSPVLDINSNPNNPIIGLRSFGENKENVLRKSLAYMKGLQHGKILACGKHFPGHGNTFKDSHLELPIVSRTIEQLDSVELYPFRGAFAQGLGSVMVGHLDVRAYSDKKTVLPSTLNKEVVTTLLKEKMNYKGLIFTDALNMKGVTDNTPANQAPLKAFLAGCDVLLFPKDVSRSIKEFKKAYKKNKISEKLITLSAQKIIKAKEWTGLFDIKNKIDSNRVKTSFSDLRIKKEIHKLYAKSLTLLANHDSTLPLSTNTSINKVAFVTINGNDENNFINSAKQYADITGFHINSTITDNALICLQDSLIKHFSTVVVSFHQNDEHPWIKDSVDTKVLNFLSILSAKKAVVYVHFANPYVAKELTKIKFKAFLMAYQDNYYTNNSVAAVIFGAEEITGKLPITLNKYKEGLGLQLKKKSRLNYFYPDRERTYIPAFSAIDSIAKKGIEDKAYPGCQVLVAHKGTIIYNKNFGFQTYKKKIRVQDNTVYDIASITKIAATTLAIMKLQDKNKININNKLGDYLSDLISDTSGYYYLNLCEILSHKSGLPAWIPFFKYTMCNKQLNYKIYSLDSSKNYTVKIHDKLYMNHNYKDSIYNKILQTKLKPKSYRYSDLGFYFLKNIVEKQASQKLEDFTQAIYDDIGMYSTGFFPLRRNKKINIAPTENDRLFRKAIIKGYVHDPGAAMIGGVGGHAGLFSTANDLAKLMEMYLNKGKYGGKVYLSDSVVTKFSSRQYAIEDTRRGLGFDKPTLGNGGPCYSGVADSSFGHGGFTGCLAWSDPKYEIVYVFLSNRTYPDITNNKIIKNNIKTNIQKVVYQELLPKE